MTDMVLLHCGENDFTTGPMPLREAVAYIAEAAEDEMDCVGTHELREVEQTVPVDFKVPFPYVPQIDQPNVVGEWDW